jgi:hypothetical protein
MPNGFAWIALQLEDLGDKRADGEVFIGDEKQRLAHSPCPAR